MTHIPCTRTPRNARTDAIQVRTYDDAFMRHASSFGCFGQMFEHLARNLKTLAFLGDRQAIDMEKFLRKPVIRGSDVNLHGHAGQSAPNRGGKSHNLIYGCNRCGLSVCIDVEEYILHRLDTLFDNSMHQPPRAASGHCGKSVRPGRQNS